MKSTYQRLRDKRSKNDSFWVESFKIDFVVELTKLLNRRGLSYAKLAQKLEKSPAYISKVFAGDENLTIESMVKLVRALDGKIHFHVSEDGCDVRWFDIVKNRRVQERHPDLSRENGKTITEIDAAQEYYAAA